MPHVVIVGAGISGLSLAYRLQQAAPGANVTLLEARERPGGTIWTRRDDGFTIEAGPNGFLDSKPSTVQLCRDLGIESQLVAASPAAGKNRYLFLDGKLKPLPGSLWSFLTSDLLSVRGKLSLLWERFRSQGPGGDESIYAFARRRAGIEVAEVFADALVTGIHAGDPRALSLPATFPRLAALEREYGSVLRGLAQSAKKRRAEAKARGEPYRRPGQMWSFREGLGLLVETLAARLAKPPLLGVPVKTIQRRDGDAAWSVLAEGGDAWAADAVVLACPAYRQAALLAELDSELAELIGGIAYNRVAVVALGFRQADVPRPLDGFGYIAPQSTRRDVLGVQWCSSIFPGRAPEGMVLLRAMCGGWHRPDAAAWDDARLLQAVRADLRQALGITAEPVRHCIVRWDRAIPQYQLGHLQRLARIEACRARYPGLFLAGNAYQGVSLNDCTEQAEVFAGRVSAFLRESPP